MKKSESQNALQVPYIEQRSGTECDVLSDRRMSPMNVPRGGLTENRTWMIVLGLKCGVGKDEDDLVYDRPWLQCEVPRRRIVRLGASMHR
jgi:hypothetical protein